MWLQHLSWFWIIPLFLKSFQPINATSPFYLLGSERTSVVLRWGDWWRQCWVDVSHFKKVFLKEYGVHWEEKRNWKHLVLKDHRNLPELTSPSARETKSKVQRSLTWKVFHLSHLSVYHLGDFNQHIKKEFTFKDISWRRLPINCFSDIFIQFQVEFCS